LSFFQGSMELRADELGEEEAEATVDEVETRGGAL
jgi:hypothetical protein